VDNYVYKYVDNPVDNSMCQNVNTLSPGHQHLSTAPFTRLSTAYPQFGGNDIDVLADSIEENRYPLLLLLFFN
jgi:hypothetical protein